MIAFMLICCNMRIAISKIEARLVIAFVLVFAIICSMILFNTWLDRFSGNVNFFYFQTIVYNFLLVVIFIQMFQALSQKIKTYQKLFEEIKNIRAAAAKKKSEEAAEGRREEGKGKG